MSPLKKEDFILMVIDESHSQAPFVEKFVINTVLYVLLTISIVMVVAYKLAIIICEKYSFWRRNFKTMFCRNGYQV